MQDSTQAFAEFGRGGHAERDTAVLDRLLCARDASGHCGFRREERARNLQRAQATDSPQRERDLRCGRQCRMAAHRHQDERVVGVDRALIGGWRNAFGRQHPLSNRVLAALARLLAAQQVRQPAGGDPQYLVEDRVGVSSPQSYSHKRTANFS